MSAIRESYVEHFGEEEAQKIERAAEEHGNGINDTKKGSDAFRWAISIVIGYQCAEKDGYREHHGITAPWPAVKQWIKDHADLANHDGDVDYLCMFGGGYNEYMPKQIAAESN